MSVSRTIHVLIKLIPLIISLRRDRKAWVKTEGKNLDYSKFQKNANKVLNTFVSLGPVYIKLGQWLSSRADILPQPYLEELSKLQDDVPAESFDKIKPIIEKDLGSLEKFTSINQKAISGASLGQVYLAKIKDQDVIVKVKRPGIEDIINQDIKVLKKVLPLAMRFVDPNLRFSAQSMLSQFIETIHEELDYTIESKNLKTIKKNLTRHQNVRIPEVYDDYSTKNVLTMEYIPGIKITNIEDLDKKGIDRQKIVIDVHKVFFTMLLRDSIFHADPHPGNISIADDGSLILYDFGMVGKIDNETRMRIVRLYLALVEKDPPRTVNAMSDLGMLTPDFNRSVIEQGIDLSIRTMYGKKPDEMEVKALMELANKTMSKFPFMLPKNLALYLRMSSIIEGIYKTHKVDFKFVKVLKNILEEEQLIKDAYIEEIKHSFTRFAKSIDATISIAPELKKFLEENRSFQLNAKPRRDVLLAGSILSSAVFIGSAVLYSSNNTAAAAGMIGAFVIMGIFTIFRKH
ncbi:ABC1 kinase family protein [Candidatus Nitrosotenuis cloacae]|uniref:Protein kinase n=1 Tax=Candidatus Nitrosotenuis cloacae TaxID=1603555 RepID=A0A3G1B4Q9_9ARCH|nr:AarF/ABC1/UbiB kinase family protein [Candidatus Nitrosotenuis cloacae]AJZ75948.1 protein kinase [Candidatus Nitrosotenuis cloacae]